MGLLDDAIKDHLELKRRHGADPGEVARLEHEALGPARREPVSATAEAELEEPVAHEPVEPASAAESFYDHEDDDEVPADERLEAPVREVEPEPPAPEPAAPAPEPEPELAAEPAPEPDVPSVEQPTRQFSLEELEAASHAPAEAAEEEEAADDEPDEPPARPAAEADVVPADDEPEGEDVLEETPEFLQETPEHDRLWFEQKPPRDFDF